jgi:hypothetical protein
MGVPGGRLQNIHLELKFKKSRIERKLDSATSYLKDAWILLEEPGP